MNKIEYSIHNSIFGKTLIASQEDGHYLCAIEFGKDVNSVYEAFRKRFLTIEEEVEFKDKELGRKELISKALSVINGENKDYDQYVSFLVGSPFQKRVWNKIRTILYGETQSYKDIAAQIGSPKAYRAVANACSANPIPIICPCHRVIHSNGDIGGYGYGNEMKKKLLERENKNDKSRI
jgi:methylated-DNA-[protein]-cysteine S-methyltransferase